MSEKVNLFQKPKNKQNPKNKNISKTKALTKKSKVTRNSQTPIKTQLSNKTYMNNNNNTMIYPNNNNFNINNNISININIDMTNERNKSLNIKNKNQIKKTVITNNNLIINTLKKIQNKANIKKSPFHIRIKTTNLGLKDFKYKPKANPKNKVYQNRLNYYNISNKSNFNIFSHKFEEKKPENKSNIIDNENKNISLNKTPIIEKTNKIYKELKEKNIYKKKKENSKSVKDL